MCANVTWKKLEIGALWLLVVLGMVGLLPLSAGAGARNPCTEPGNLTQNGTFDVFVDHMVDGKRLQVPGGWWYFILAGSPDFRPAEDTYWGAPSLAILSDGVPFTAGVYQEVPVTPGVVYQTDIGWAAARCNFQVCPNTMERRLGLDPAGGTDPRAPSVVWSRVEAGGDPWPDLTVSARAEGPTMTVFVWVHHPSSSGLDEVYLDAVGLWPDPSQPAQTSTPVPSPTPTRTPSPVPPTDTPTAPPPTPTSTEAPTATPTPLPSDGSTELAEVTPTPTRSPTAPSPSPEPPTPSPTPPPTPTALSVARLAPTPVAQVQAAMPAPRPTGRRAGSNSLLLYVALGALAGALVLGGVVSWLWLRDPGDAEPAE